MYLGAILSVVALGTAVGLLALAVTPSPVKGAAAENVVMESPRWLAVLITANAAAGLGALLLGARLLAVSRRESFPTPSVPARFYLGGLLLVLGTAPVADIAAQWASLVTGTEAASAEIAIVAAVRSSAPEFVWVLLAFAVGPAVTEELLFRGLLTAAFSRFGVLPALVWPSLLFGLYHLEVAQAVGTVLLGLSFGWMRLRTGSVLPSMVAHGAYNAIVLVMLRASGSPAAHTPELSERLPLLAIGALLLWGAMALLRRRNEPRPPATAKSRSRAAGGRLSLALDQAVLHLGGLRRHPRRASEPTAHRQRLERLAALARELRETPRAELWPEPEQAISKHGVARIGLDSRRVELSWPSSHRPVIAAGQRWYDAAPRNGQAMARAWLSEPPRPVVVLIHGYFGGHSALERFVWPAQELRELGFDVCWLLLPFHGRRAPSLLRPPPFPGPHPDLNVEALRQAVLDLRELASWLRERGHPRVGTIGFSLGGYVAALAATVEAELDFVIPVAPCASLGDLARDHGSLGGGGAAQGELHAALEALYEPLSPLRRRTLVPAERWLVVSGDSDIVTGLPHARALAAHVGARLCVITEGGHALLAWNRSAKNAIREFLLSSVAASR